MNLISGCWGLVGGKGKKEDFSIQGAKPSISDYVRRLLGAVLGLATLFLRSGGLPV